MVHTKRLSILICSLEEREIQRIELLTLLKKQCSVYQPDQVEVLTEIDSGEMSIGAKRNLLLSRAAGAYSAFVDDDDLVSENYVSAILKAIDSEPDCVGIRGTLYVGGGERTFEHSIEHAGWYEGQDGVYYRTPNHLNPIRTEISLRVGFPDVNFGEDHSFSNKARSYLKTEVFIDESLYLYRYTPKGTQHA